MVDVQAADGSTVHSMGTQLKTKAMDKPIWSGLILPALDSYAKAAFADPKAFAAAMSKLSDRVRVSVDGTILAPEQKDTKIAAMLKAESPGYQFTRIVIALPLLGEQAPPAKKPVDADKAAFHIDIRSLDGVLLTSLECALPKGSFNKPLVKAVVAPALKQYVKLSPEAPRVAYDAIKIEVDGVLTSGEASAISYAKAPNEPVQVKLTMPTTSAPASGDEEGAAAPSSSGTKKKKGAKKGGTKESFVAKPSSSPKFVIDLQTDEGETLSSFGTELNAKFLAMPVAKAIVQPLITQFCKQHGVALDPKSIRIVVNGQQLEPNATAKCSSFLTADADVVGVVLLLPVGFKLPDATGPLTSADIHVIVRFISSESAEFDVKLNEKWLAEPLVRSIVKPALKTINQPGLAPDKVVVRVDGDHVEPSDLAQRPSSSFIKRPGVVTRIELSVPDYDVALSRSSSVLDTVVSGAKQVVGRLADSLSASMAILEPAQFQVNIHGGLKRWETETQLAHKWLNKSLKDGLIAPALKAYFRDDIGSVPVVVDDPGLKVEVNGAVISSDDLNQRAETFVDRQTNATTPTRVDIHLPTRQYTLKRISKAA